MQPERDFNYQGPDDARVVRMMGRPGRWAKSWFSFDLPVEPAHPMALAVTYCSSRRSRQAAIFDILVDGQQLANQKVTRSSPARFYDVEYTVPAKIVRGKKKVTVRFGGYRRQHNRSGVWYSHDPCRCGALICENDRDVARHFYKKYINDKVDEVIRVDNTLNVTRSALPVFLQPSFFEAEFRFLYSRYLQV